MILVLNCGSSSVKYRLFDSQLQPVRSGLVEHIGEPGGPPTHEAALHTDLGLTAPDLTAVGHRVVHGGARFTAPTLLTDEVVAALGELTPLAPLHNPPALAGIAVTRKLRPDLPQVAVFDTAFHATIPPAAHTYALDRELAHRHGIRRYGFHGTSHAYVSRRTAALVGRTLAEVNTIVLHLGNGASACAVRGGVSVETSMGFTPLEGLVMGSRSGDLDPAVVAYLHRVAGLSVDEVDDLLNRRSGMRGLTGDNDMRAVTTRAAAGDPAAQLALDVYCHRLRKYVGAYTAVLGRLDAITFTGGIGEHATIVRESTLDGLDALGIRLDPTRDTGDGERIISAADSPVTVCVIPTDEEYEIASQVLSALPANNEGTTVR